MPNCCSSACSSCAPDYRPTRYDYAAGAARAPQVLAQALDELEQLLALEPGNRAYRSPTPPLRRARAGPSRRSSAIASCCPIAPRPAADLHLSIAHALKTLGRQQEAIESYRAAAPRGPIFGDAYWSLANLKTYRFTRRGARRACALQEAAPTTALADRYHLCFALGKALEDRGEFAESFGYYERGNALEEAREPVPARARSRRNTRLQTQVCTREFFAARRRLGRSGADPIFIVGLPRVGLDAARANPRLPLAGRGHDRSFADIPRMVGTSCRAATPISTTRAIPRSSRELTAEDFARLGRALSRRHPGLPHAASRVFIDKMPNNFRHIGLIHLILPNARIIDARREPMACCFSNFKQLFAYGQEFTYSLEDIARYYRTYVELMRHWDEALPGRVLRVQHEDVVEDLEGSVRRMLDFCGLDFEPACLEFHKTERSVRTASSEQVRQPIFKEGLDQWRHFEPWLGELRDALGRFGPARRAGARHAGDAGVIIDCTGCAKERPGELDNFYTRGWSMNGNTKLSYAIAAILSGSTAGLVHAAPATDTAEASSDAIQEIAVTATGAPRACRTCRSRCRRFTAQTLQQLNISDLRRLHQVPAERDLGEQRPGPERGVHARPVRRLAGEPGQRLDGIVAERRHLPGQPVRPSCRTATSTSMPRT